MLLFSTTPLEKYIINCVIELAVGLSSQKNAETKHKYEPREPLSDLANKIKSPKTENLCVFFVRIFLCPRFIPFEVPPEKEAQS